MVASLPAKEDGCEEGISSAGAEVAEEIGCTLLLGLVDGTGGSVLRFEDGSTGMLPVASVSCSSGPLASPCWLASVELENLEAILTYVYYLLDVPEEIMTDIAHLLDRWL